VIEDITAVDLLSALQRILDDMGEAEVTSIQRRKITLRMRIREIWRKVSEASGQLVFEDLFDGACDRVGVVMTFLALLELLKMRKVRVKQKSTFAPIEIIPVTE
jgi:segregation and condensation protein A